MTALLAFHDIPGVLTAVVAVVALVASGLLGLQYGTVHTLRETNGDLRNRVADLEKGRADDRTEIAQLQSDLDALARLKTGQDALIRLEASHRAHIEAAEQHWATEERLLGQLLSRREAK